MEENKVVSKAHKIILTNRRNGSLSGVLDVLSFDVNEILLETELGMLHIKGKDLHVNHLNLEKGDVEIEGMIEAFSYSQVPAITKKTESVWKKMFR